MDHDLLEHIEIETGENPTSSIIWLHGLGADGHDFEPIVPELNLPDSLRIRFIFPHAPRRLINGEQEMRAWYDFVPHSENSGGDDIQISQKQINAFIERELDRGIFSNKILLAGFSQGGVIALHTALRFKQRLAGVLALSTYLHDTNQVESERDDANLALPIMMAHGTQDPVIPIVRAATSRENLIRLGYDVSWFDYPMGHQVCLEEIEEVSRFFQTLL
ncbi:MAG: alpha/beta hydrolase [Pseudomonadales bacterium]|nr:alpha/beta hydrolase [Pseudomonadales bacterium]